MKQMLFESNFDMYKLKKGDKVVVEISGITNTPYGEHTAFVCNNSQYLPDGAILGKLEDFQPSEKKIKMAPEEKKEFDKLKRNYKELFLAFSDIYDEEYPNLFDRLFDDDDAEENNKAQLDFARAWDKPSRIEVEKEEKKYYVHLLENDPCGYLNYDVSAKEYFIGSKGEFDNYKTKFTKSEIAKMHFDNFKFNDKALEEVEDENE